MTKRFSRQLIACVVLLVACFNVLAKNTIEGIRVWPAPDNTRVVFDLSAKPQYKYFRLTNPQRLVIDFQNSQNIVQLKNLAKNDPRISKIRTSTSKTKGTTRVVLDLKKEYQLAVFPLSPAGQYGNRLVIDLYDRKRTSQVAKAPANNQRDIVIGIDAGHGGEDPGSIGPKGTYEKRVTLAIAKKLQKMINKEKGMRAVMIRSGDYYVDIDKRTRIARKNSVDFLVSIHADAFRTSQPSGASIWIVSSRRAESELARWLDNRQKNSELLGGGGGVIKTTEDDNLAKTLADMNREHSLEVSISMATKVLKELKKVTKLHKKTPQYKSLGVLKSSDIPSMLVETGFISNHKEEKNLMWSKHQTRLANAMFVGIKSYFLDFPPQGTYFASNGYRKHKVRSGESLSVLAKRYQTSIKDIKTANNLSSNVVKVGQTLKIPRAD